MSKKRVVLRSTFSEELSDSQQEEFIDEVQGWLDGTGINGYFVTQPSSGWIEWEGDAGTIDDKVDQYEADSRVETSETVEECTIESTNGDSWYGHAVSDAYASL